MHPQLQQLVNLFLLLLIGKYTNHLYLGWGMIFSLLFLVYMIDYVLYRLADKALHILSFSSFTTAIGMMLMMVTTQYYIYCLVLFFALFQKHFLQYKTRHFFNPSNFALITALLFFYDDAHIVLGQLGHNIWSIWVVIAIGILILYRVKRWILPLSFVLSYLVLQYFVIVNTDPVIMMEDIYHRFYSVSFVVFVLFMLTDPRTTPTKLWHQIVFAMGISSFATYLDYMNGFRVQHLFIVLFVCSPWVVLVEEYKKTLDKKVLILVTLTIIFLALSVIIYIEMQPPYYFEMDK
jgi:Na+-translocating ferredoxin:NAD+ oxidoreductase RnfD subunit